MNKEELEKKKLGAICLIILFLFAAIFFFNIPIVHLSRVLGDFGLSSYCILFLVNMVILF